MYVVRLRDGAATPAPARRTRDQSVSGREGRGKWSSMLWEWEVSLAGGEVRDHRGGKKGRQGDESEKKVDGGDVVFKGVDFM